MNKAVSLDNLSLEALIERGSLLLKQEKFPDAIACFKHLLKLEERVDFLQGLEQAYLGRIIALANKSMLYGSTCCCKQLTTPRRPSSTTNAMANCPMNNGSSLRPCLALCCLPAMD